MGASSISPFSSLWQWGSMVLYRLAGEDDTRALIPPKMTNNRDSIASDLKYPCRITYGESRGSVPHAYDSAVDNKEPPDDENLLHDPDGKGARWEISPSGCPLSDICILFYFSLKYTSKGEHTVPR